VRGARTESKPLISAVQYNAALHNRQSSLGVNGIFEYSTILRDSIGRNRNQSINVFSIILGNLIILENHRGTEGFHVSGTDEM
jgi:hypothetical protein